MRTKMFFPLICAAALMACQGNETPKEQEEIEKSEHVKPESETRHADADIQEKGGVSIYPKKEVARFEKATLKRKAPKDRGKVDGKEVTFEFEVEGFELGQQTDKARRGLANSEDGQHIHLIIDNGPYSAHYEPAFEKELSPGNHYAIAFLSRSYHESVKNADAYEVFQFTVGSGKSEQGETNLNQPMLFYSRPKGTYKGEDTKKILLDFYLHNVELSADGHQVIATINDSLEFKFDKWQPYIIEGLPMGENSITLKLVDSNGSPVNSKLNTVTRKFKLE